VTVLVTRAAQDSEKTIARLSQHGIEAIAAPAIEIRTCGEPDLPAACRALIVTSANAIRAIAGRAELSGLLGIPLYAVGDRTAEAARQAGFTQVRSASGTVGDLAGLVCAEIEPHEGVLMHVRGREVAGELGGELASAGYTVERRIVYESVCADQLPEAAVGAMETGVVDAVLLYSPKSADYFGRLTAKAGLAGRLADMTAVVMSLNVADRARAAGFGHTIVANRPDESALIGSLERFLKGRLKD